eukprot:TRINITY_DN4508_c0_g1_i4.p1 TRINITY_DN4508_c0_g1~~TRINITY_DN4508_c0_g1_i4.p1  ORF type:complete len:305 (+),score=72.66 TRINITY_DN4508_c0_g1_i4:44-958(+)
MEGPRVGVVLSRLRKAFDLNTAQRAKHVDSPALFVDSEIELSSALEACRSVAALEFDATARSEYTQLVDLLVMILPHQNTDIVSLVIGTLMDLLQSSSELLQVFVKADGFTLLVQTLGILNGESQDDLEAFDRVLSIIENAVDAIPDPIASSLLKDGFLVEQLLRRMKSSITEKSLDGDAFDALGLYCSEILAILIQATQVTRLHESKKILQSHESLIKTLADIARYYCQSDPSSKEETEFAANVINCLCEIMLNNQAASIRFQQEDGLEICLNLMRKKSFGRTFGLKILTVSLFGNPFFVFFL